jgi:hypothetical protein
VYLSRRREEAVVVMLDEEPARPFHLVVGIDLEDVVEDFNLPFVWFSEK